MAVFLGREKEGKSPKNKHISCTIIKITAVCSTAKQFPSVGLTVQFTSWANIAYSVVICRVNQSMLYLEKVSFISPCIKIYRTAHRHFLSKIQSSLGTSNNALMWFSECGALVSHNKNGFHSQLLQQFW